jgi:precorrin-6x reductase
MVIAGTADAKKIIAQLKNEGTEVFATVTTNYGQELLEIIEGIEIVRGKLDSDAMEKFITDRKIDCLVDASHPFAKEASINAIEASKKAQVPYLRYERLGLDLEDTKVIKVKDFQAAAEACCGFQGNILLTIGSNNISTFAQKVDDYKNRLFARILPDSRMVAKCEEAGLSAGNIIAIKGPFSIEMNIAMLKHCKASVMVTKESGDTGGMGEKLEAAKQLGIPVIIVERPQISYGKMTSSVEEVLDFIKALI